MKLQIDALKKRIQANNAAAAEQAKSKGKQARMRPLRLRTDKLVARLQVPPQTL